MYKEDEKVLVYHGPLLYEAKIVQRVQKESADHISRKLCLYLVHYLGWDTHWNEWVAESRVLKHTAVNLNKQKERVKEFQRAHKRKTRTTPPAADAAAAKKQATTAGKTATKPEPGLLSEIKEQLRLPHSMKLRLIEDWERITREKKLVPLPVQNNISSLLEDFVQAKAKRTTHVRLYEEVTDGIKSYFNQALGSVLLYKYERRQFRETKDADKGRPLVDIYGAEHLLRLFVKLPELLAHCKMQREHVTVLVAKLVELLKFMQTNKSKYFTAAYITPDDAYLQWWGNE